MSRAQANLPSKSGLRKNIVCVRAAGELQNKAWLMLSIQFRNILVYTSEGVKARRCIILSSEEILSVDDASHRGQNRTHQAPGALRPPCTHPEHIRRLSDAVTSLGGVMLEHGEITMIPDPNAPQWNARGVLWYPARFVRRHESRAGEDGEYEFEWLECMKGIVYHSSSSATLLSNLRTFCKGRKFCQAIHEVNDNLQSKQIGKVRLPFYMEPDHPSHKDPELERIFHAALPHVAKILATFPDDHPVIASFNKYFSGKKATEHHRGAGEWMRTLSLVPTPQLEAILEPSLQSLARHMHLVHVPEPELQRRLLGVGSALLQLLAVQRELGEALNLNGDVLQDLLTGRVVPRSFDGPEALLVMFKACMIADGSSVSATTRMLKFNEAHVICDQDYSEPTFRRLAPSIFQPSAAIPVVLKRNGDENIVNEKPAKRTKTTKTQQAKKKQTIESDMRGSRTTGRRLRSGKVV
ncbi:hypothetical protein GGX14DRAFT_392181 [Mycena pura]|uniref:Uncharacterized protein n=1 Tax=Mycena pura TaxID=153505 RepID=A0AAD6VL58_9AGAR|nr:hypothetical protein GGX14DRAFT_392181 [Mycena pura]